MNQYCQMLSNSLLRLADCSRRVSLRFKSEVLDPLKTFNENYENIYEDIKRKVNERIELVVGLTFEHGKLKDNFNQAYEKFEKHKEIQKKVIEKIESGNKSELEKYYFVHTDSTPPQRSLPRTFPIAKSFISHQWRS